MSVATNLFETPSDAQEIPVMPPGGSQNPNKRTEAKVFVKPYMHVLRPRMAPRKHPGGSQETLKKHERQVLAALHQKKHMDVK